MRDELDRMISSYFEERVKRVPAPPLPAFFQETATRADARISSRRAETFRHPAVSAPAALSLKLALSAAIATICVLSAPPKAAAPVARGVEVLLANAEFRSTLRSAAAEIAFETGRSLSKE